MGCEPDEQSADDLTAVLHASRGSISMTTRSLIRAGWCSVRISPETAEPFYRIDSQAWTAVFEQQANTTKRLRSLAQQGLTALDGTSPERRRRLVELEDLTAFYEREAPALLQHWRQQRHRFS